MVALWILGILLALLLLILLLRVGADIRWKQGVELWLRVGPVKYRILPQEKKERKPRKEKKKPSAKTEKAKDTKKRKPTAADLRAAAPTLWKALQRGLTKTRRRLRIHPLELCVVFGGDDPAKVAQAYGWASTAMWTVMPQMEELVRMRDPHIHLDVDYNAEKTVTEGEIGVSLRVWDSLVIGFAFGIPLLKWYRVWKKMKAAAVTVDGDDKAAESAPEEERSKTTAK